MLDKLANLKSSIIHKVNADLPNKKTLVKTSAILIIIGASYALLAYNFTIGLNTTTSLPYHLVLIKKHTTPTTHDQLFAFKTPDSARYYHGKTMLKLVGGLPGDEIKIKEVSKQSILYVNQTVIGVIKERTLRGDSIAPTNQIGIIPKGKIFAYTPHKDSYDSRYQEIGLIDAGSILGVAIAPF